MTQPTSTSYALLGLLSIRPWTAYDLVRQSRRNLRLFWQRSEAHLYAELKRLAKLRYADAEEIPVGRRTRTQYSITDVGREALREWLTTPPAAPMLEFEGLLRVMYADQGSVENLLASLRATNEYATAALEQGVRQATEALTDGGQFPERLHLGLLFADFSSSYLLLVADWSARAAKQVATWNSTGERELTPSERAALAGLIERMTR